MEIYIPSFKTWLPRTPFSASFPYAISVLYKYFSKSFQCNFKNKDITFKKDQKPLALSLYVTVTANRNCPFSSSNGTAIYIYIMITKHVSCKDTPSISEKFLWSMNWELHGKIFTQSTFFFQYSFYPFFLSPPPRLIYFLTKTKRHTHLSSG